MLSGARNSLLRGWRAAENVFDRAFGVRDNPLRHLGALGFWFFWVATASGIYLYAFFDTSVVGAWRSVEALTHGQPLVGGMARSLHRYASDGFVAVMLLHLVKETLAGHYRGFRMFSWLTGVPLIWLVYVSGIGGYWLVWDRVAQFSATATMEWLDWLPLFREPLARNFLHPGSVSDRFFSLLVFMHIGVPLLLLLGMWAHIQRISLADTAPPRRLGWGLAVTLLALSLLKPALSAPPAALGSEPAAVAIDWFYLFVHPLTYATSEGFAWALVFGATLLLAAAPLLARPRREPVAKVDPRNCNGCGRCVADCPYAAVLLVPHSLKGKHRMQAQVDPDLCAACGICAGACPSSTPFRRMETLVSGIDLPSRPVVALRTRLDVALARMSSAPRIVAFGCEHAAKAGASTASGVAVLELPCLAALPPSFIEYALRNGADGVLLTGCGEGDCEYRLGGVWMEQRIAGTRMPRLRRHVPRGRVEFVQANAGQEKHLMSALARFRKSLSRH
jgi:coenzyme F420-reducing hydrogenase delta subunit/ferredoxin